MSHCYPFLVNSGLRASALGGPTECHVRSRISFWLSSYDTKSKIKVPQTNIFTHRFSGTRQICQGELVFVVCPDLGFDIGQRESGQWMDRLFWVFRHFACKFLQIQLASDVFNPLKFSDWLLYQTSCATLSAVLTICFKSLKIWWFLNVQSLN